MEETGLICLEWLGIRRTDYDTAYFMTMVTFCSPLLIAIYPFLVYKLYYTWKGISGGDQDDGEPGDISKIEDDPEFEQIDDEPKASAETKKSK